MQDQPQVRRKSGDAIANNRISASVGSRPPSASKNQDDTANSTTAQSGSRPPSAAKTQGETATTEQQDTSAAAVDPNNPNVTQPVIGRPGSGIKKESTGVNLATPAAAAQVVPQSGDTTAAPAGPPPPSTPRAGSASKKPPGADS
jgi:hypothetical protein